MLTIEKWKRGYEDGDLSDAKNAKKAGWTEWACRDSALARKTKAVYGLVGRLGDGGKLFPNTHRITLKNVDPEDGKQYDIVIFWNDDEVSLVCTMGDVRHNDGSKWHVYDYVNTDGSRPVAAFDSVVQLAKWLNEPFEPEFDGKSSIFTTTNPMSTALIERAVADAREKFGENAEFTEIWKKYFGNSEQAMEWLRNRLPSVENGMLLVAMHGRECTVGYVLK